ncbi:MAG: metal-dependent transcriptional regulator [Niabella sp.]
MTHLSYTEENYIKAIFHLQEGKKAVTTNELADYLQTKPASITDMLKKLAQKKIVGYKAYYGCTLSSEGRKIALSIIRRHRLWEYFLSQKLGMNWDEVHDLAEQLEHVSSEKLIDSLDNFLGHPRFDPHGDPIPDKTGKMITEQQASLANLKENSKGKVSQIGNQSSEILSLLEENGIALGTHIEIIKRHSFDQSLEIKIDKKQTRYITKELALNIFIKSL